MWQFKSLTVKCNFQKLHLIAMCSRRDIETHMHNDAIISLFCEIRLEACLDVKKMS